MAGVQGKDTGAQQHTQQQKNRTYAAGNSGGKARALCAETQKPREDKKRVQNDVDNAAQRHACGGGQRTAAGTEKVG